MKTYKDSLNAANPNNLADLLREFDLGDFLRAMPTQLHAQAPAADASNLSTVRVVKLPDDAKACTVLRATGKAGSVTGEFAPQAFGTTPATTQVAVTPCGDIAFIGTDAPTNVDLAYVPERGEVMEFTLDVASHVLTIPSPYASRVKLLLEAEATTGTTLGKKVILIPGSSAPSATQARLNVAKTTVTFATADAVTKARVKVLLAPASSVAAKFDEDAKY